MIKANELRIGNWILAETLPGLPMPHKVLGQDIADLSNGRITLNALRPIRLIHPLLRNCGFELFPWGYVKQSENGFGVRLHPHSFQYAVSGNNPVKLKYLHQLQNLYFALTGEELTVKL